MQDELVLNYLKERPGSYFSGADISKKLKVTRTAIWKHIENLRKLGYEIEAEPRLGYRLSKIPDKLYKDEIVYKLDTKILGKKTVLCYESLDSTNTACFKLGEQNIEEGACIFSEHQAKGKGRLGRQWESEKGKNILMSVLFRPLLAPSQVARMTLLAAVSLAKAIKTATGVSVEIKWPNDILYKEKKLCGILTEMSAEADRVNFVVVGIGINMNSDSSKLPENAASLKVITGREIPRVDFIKEFLRQLEKDYLLLRDGNFKPVMASWEEFSATSGKRVEVDVLGRKVQGQALGIDEDGALWLRRDSGLQEKITAGDVRHLRPA